MDNIDLIAAKKRNIKGKAKLDKENTVYNLLKESSYNMTCVVMKMLCITKSFNPSHFTDLTSNSIFDKFEEITDIAMKLLCNEKVHLLHEFSRRCRYTLMSRLLTDSPPNMLLPISAGIAYKILNV